MQYAIERGMIDLSYVQEQIKMNQRRELLEKHPYAIWEGKDGNWHTYLPDKEKGRVPKKRTTKEAIEDVVAEYWEAEMENPTIREVFEEWNDRRLKLEKIQPSTNERNAYIFDKFFKEIENERIKSIKPEKWGEFLEEQIPKYKLTAKSFSNLKGVTYGFLRRAKKRKLIEFNVVETFMDLDISDVEFKKVIKEDYQEVFNEVEMPIMLEYLEKNIDIINLGILLMFVTGIRIGEAVALKHSDFDGNAFNIRRTETRYYDKENKRHVYTVKEFPKSQAGVRTSIIPNDYSWLAQRLKLQNPFDEYIFVKNGKRLTTASLRSRLRRICKKVNIYHKSPHKIRKTYGTILLDNHIDNQLIMGQMGHTDISCTENHYHRNRKTVERKMEILSNIPEFKMCKIN